MAITSSGTYWLTQEKFLTLATGLTSYESTSAKYGLTNDTYTHDFDLHDFRADIGANEISGTGYTAGGNALVSPALTISSGMAWDFNDPQWTSSSLTGVMAGFMASGNATAADDELYHLHDFVTAVTTSNGTLDVAINGSGAVTWA
jgi:hypothetical protein